jgi:hypothetical protein
VNPIEQQALAAALFIITFVPVGLLLYFILGRYEPPRTRYTYFDERKVVYALLMGVGCGIGVAFLWVVYSDTFYDTNYIDLALGLLITFAVLETVMIAAVMNNKFFRAKFDATFYGFAFGLGLGSIVFLWQGLRAVNASVPSDPAVWALLVVYSLASSAVHAGVGGMMGAEMHRNSMVKGVGFGALLLVLNSAILFPFYLRTGPWMAASVAGSLVLGMILVYLFVTDVVPEALPREASRRPRVRRRPKG